MAHLGREIWPSAQRLGERLSSLPSFWIRRSHDGPACPAAIAPTRAKSSGRAGVTRPELRITNPAKNNPPIAPAITDNRNAQCLPSHGRSGPSGSSNAPSAPRSQESTGPSRNHPTRRVNRSRRRSLGPRANRRPPSPSLLGPSFNPGSSYAVRSDRIHAVQHASGVLRPDESGHYQPL